MRCRRLTKRYKTLVGLSSLGRTVESPDMPGEGEKLLAPEKCLAIEFRYWKGKNDSRSTHLLVSHLVADFNYIRGDTILKNFDGLRSLYMVYWCKQRVASSIERILTGTLRARSLMRSRALRIEAGSKVLQGFNRHAPSHQIRSAHLSSRSNGHAPFDQVKSTCNVVDS